MPNPATVDDLVARWRPLSDQETTNAQAFLDDAWSLLTERRRTLEADMTAGTVSTATATRVVCAMVLRVLKNPDGYESESFEDWTGRRNAVAASGALEPTADELADLTPVSTTARKASVRLTVYGDA